jgi:hypothetical protein
LAEEFGDVINQTTEVDEMITAFDQWQDYNKQGNGYKISFVNGKLNSFRDGNDMQWWNRMDEPSNKLVNNVNKKIEEPKAIKTEQVAEIKFSKNLNKSINDMIERSRGLSTDEVISAATAKIRGKETDSSIANRLRMFVPPAADDFVGLTYYMLGKGKQGDADMKFFKENCSIK